MLGTIYGRSEELVSRCIECDLAEPESLASLGGSAPGLVDGILSIHPNKQCQLCRKLAPKGFSYRPNDFQIAFRMDHAFFRGPHHMGFQDANNYSIVNHRGRVHCPLHQFEGGDPHDGDPQRSMGARTTGRLPASQNPLHCVRSQQWWPVSQKSIHEQSTPTSHSIIFMSTWNARSYS